MRLTNWYLANMSQVVIGAGVPSSVLFTHYGGTLIPAGGVANSAVGIEYVGSGTYAVLVSVPTHGGYSVLLQLGGETTGHLSGVAKCPESGRTEALASGQCGCARGLYLKDSDCVACPSRLSSEVGSTMCEVCASGYYRDAQDPATQATCKACIKGVAALI